MIAYFFIFLVMVKLLLLNKKFIYNTFFNKLLNDILKKAKIQKKLKKFIKRNVFLLSIYFIIGYVDSKQLYIIKNNFERNSYLLREINNNW